MWAMNYKRCYCHTCEKAFHYLGIARHRAMHRSRREKCTIKYTSGKICEHNYEFKACSRIGAESTFV